MELEIDLRHYLQVLVRRWRWIALAAVVCGLFAAGLSFLRPVTYQAKASVFFRPSRSQLQLDERFVTDQPIDTAARRITLMALAHSTSIAAALPVEIRKQLGVSEEGLGDLLNHIRVNSTGDLIEIVASAALPEQARLLANAWAETVVTQVNQLYAQTSPPVSSKQVGQVEAQYAKAQQAYEQFTGANRIAELNQRIAATVSVISRTLEADQDRYQMYLARANQLDLVLRDAEVLRAQLADRNTIGLGDSIALLTLRARISGGILPQGQESQNPVQLQIDLPAAIERGEGVTLQDVNTLVGALRKDIDDTRAVAATLAAELANEGLSSASSVNAQSRAAYYQQLSALMEQREAEEGRRLAIEQERDVALEALQVVQSKASEQEVAAVQPDVELRMASIAEFPNSPAGTSAIILFVFGLVGGILLAAIFIILREVYGSIQSQPRPGSSVDHNPSYSPTVKRI